MLGRRKSSKRAAKQTPRVLKASPATTQDLAWDEQARTLELDALANIRASAEKWSASLAILLAGGGLAALLKGPKDFDKLEPFARDAGKALFFAGAALGLAATVYAAIAAQKTARNLLLPGASSWRSASNAAVTKAATQLRYSRILACLALACLVLAAGTLWWGGQAEKLYLRVKAADGSTLCGEVVAATAPVQLLKADGKKTKPLTGAQVLGAVSSCGP